MSHVDQTNCVNRSLQDILKVDKPFGGIPVVFGGHPRQILPVVCCGNRSQIVKACIHSSPLWNEIQQIKLTTNMRVAKDELAFSNYLLTVGSGTAHVHTEVGENVIQLPKEYLVATLEELISKVHPQKADGYREKYFVS